MRRSAPTPPPACAIPAFLILHRRAAFADAFVWPDDLQKMVYAYVIRAELIEHRQRAAATLTRYVLARLTRTWFVCRDMPALASHTGPEWSDLLWPHAVAMSVSWPVLCAARPGSFVFGRRVLRRSEWQLRAVAAVQRGERGPLW